MNKSLIKLIVVLSILCFQSPSAAVDRLVLTGSSTIAPLGLEIGKRFEERNPGVRIDVQTGGSSRGINDARLGLADIGMVSRALTGSERDLTAYPLALDGICIILNRSNPVTALSDNEIIGIYTGVIRNWRALGGPDRAITVVNKAEGRSTLELFLHYFSLKNSQIEAQVVIGDNQQGIKTVAGIPGAIGYVSVGTAQFEEARGVPIKRLPIAGVAPTIAAVRDGIFPLARTLNLVVKGTPSSLARRFLDFARSEAVYDLVEAQFFVPLAR